MTILPDKSYKTFTMKRTFSLIKQLNMLSKTTEGKYTFQNPFRDSFSSIKVVQRLPEASQLRRISQQDDFKDTYFTLGFGHICSGRFELLKG